MSTHMPNRVRPRSRLQNAEPVYTGPYLPELPRDRNPARKVPPRSYLQNDNRYCLCRRNTLQTEKPAANTINIFYFS